MVGWRKFFGLGLKKAETDALKEILLQQIDLARAQTEANIRLSEALGQYLQHFTQVGTPEGRPGWTDFDDMLYHQWKVTGEGEDT